MFTEKDIQTISSVENKKTQNLLNPEILDLIEKSSKETLASRVRQSQFKTEANYQKKSEAEKRYFGRTLDKEEYKKICSLESFGLKSEILVFQNEYDWGTARREPENSLDLLTLYYDENRDGTKNFAGFSRIGFWIEGEDRQRAMYVHYVKFEKDYQKLELGMELTLKREKFCQEQGIGIIRGEAETFIENVGAYATAIRGGYEFESEAEVERIREEFEHFAGSEYSLDEELLESLKRPYDFACCLLKDEQGVSKPIGKEFFLDLENGVYWHYQIRIPLAGRALEERLEYLKRKGRDDLIKEYYPSTTK